ncbi:MAG: Asp-tRNA(Asn)/Glu-tRNA(Gln) amidotransferase subunit GatB [Chitinophagales bacterium]
MVSGNDFEAVIGLEVHAQLFTASKFFCADAISFGAAPNTHAGTFTMAHPGTLPKLNNKAIEFAVKMGLACHCSIQQVNHFARKNYFYPDLPKGYQVTQHENPICFNGYLDVEVTGKIKRVRIHHIHLEEDAGKSMHDQDPFFSFIDLNRAGVPLIEIVTEPDISTPEEAHAFVTEVRKLVRYLDICDGNMEEGSLRCDANVSVRKKGDTTLGAKNEIKNLNSIRHVKQAVAFEIKRQMAAISKGEIIKQDTLSFDETKSVTYSIRSKELANDYRYFPEPDLPPVIISEEMIQRIKEQMPSLPEQVKQELMTTFSLSEYDASVLAEEKETSGYFFAVAAKSKNYKAAANWIMGPVRSYLNEYSISLKEFRLSPEVLAELIEMIDENKLSFTAASQRIFPELIKRENSSAKEIAGELGVLQESGEAIIQKFVTEAMEKFPDKIREYKQGKKGVMGLLMGEVMKLSKGTADPKVAGRLLLTQLESK